MGLFLQYIKFKLRTAFFSVETSRFVVFDHCADVTRMMFLIFTPN